MVLGFCPPHVGLPESAPVVMAVPQLEGLDYHTHMVVMLLGHGFYICHVDLFVFGGMDLQSLEDLLPSVLENIGNPQDPL